MKAAGVNNRQLLPSELAAKMLREQGEDGYVGLQDADESSTVEMLELDPEDPDYRPTEAWGASHSSSSSEKSSRKKHKKRRKRKSKTESYPNKFWKCHACDNWNAKSLKRCLRCAVKKSSHRTAAQDRKERKVKVLDYVELDNLNKLSQTLVKRSQRIKGQKVNKKKFKHLDDAQFHSLENMFASRTQKYENLKQVRFDLGETADNAKVLSSINNNAMSDLSSMLKLKQRMARVKAQDKKVLKRFEDNNDALSTLETIVQKKIHRLRARRKMREKKKVMRRIERSNIDSLEALVGRKHKRMSHSLNPDEQAGRPANQRRLQ
jgi:hypothetical protein